jgi:hypothetical protein
MSIPYSRNDNAIQKKLEDAQWRVFQFGKEWF